MILLDAYALIALAADEPAADEVEAIMREGGAGIVVVNLAEATDVLLRVHVLPEAELDDLFKPLLFPGGLSAEQSTEEDAWVAARVRSQYYDRRTSPLSMADCLLLARAIVAGRAIATTDRPVAAAGRAEGIGIVGLPDMTGARP